MSFTLFDKLKSGTGDSYADAEYVEFDSSSSDGLLQETSNLNDALMKVDRTGLGAPITSSNGDYTAIFTNRNEWFNKEVRNTDTTNGLKTFTLPTDAILTQVFNDGTNRTYPFYITISHTAGTNTDSTNRIEVRPVAGSDTISGRNFITLAIGDSVRLEKSSSTAEWVVVNEQVIVTNPTSVLNDVELQNETWDASTNGILPTTYEKGDAFRVVNAPSDGTGRFGETMEDGDWIIWESTDSGTWQETPHKWFVLPAHDVRRISAAGSNFLSTVSESDTRVDAANAGNETTIRFWISPALFSSAPLDDPDNDPNNPRPSQTIRYIGGNNHTNSTGTFVYINHFYNAYLYVGVTPSYTIQNLSRMYVRVYNIDDNLVNEYSLLNNFEYVSSISNSTYNFYVFKGSSSSPTPYYYQQLRILNVWRTTTQRDFTLNTDRVNVTANVENLQESQLDSSTAAKLNKQITLDFDDRYKLDGISETTEDDTNQTLTEFRAKTGPISSSIDDYQTFDQLPVNSEGDTSWIVVLDDHITLTAITPVSGGSGTYSPVSPSTIAGKHMYTVNLTGGTGAFNLIGTEAEVIGLTLGPDFVVDRQSLAQDVVDDLDKSLPISLTKLDANSTISYTNGANYVPKNPHVTNNNSFIYLKNTPAPGTSYPLTNPVLENEINASDVDLSLVDANGTSVGLGSIYIPNSDGSGGIAQYSHVLRGAGLFGNYIRAQFPDENNPNVLLGGWINTNKMQLSDHSDFIRVKEKNTSNYRTICSYNDQVFSFHVGNEDSVAGTPRNIRHYQNPVIAPGNGLGAINAELGQNQEAAFALLNSRVSLSSSVWNISMTLIENGEDFASAGINYTVGNKESDIAQTTHNIVFDNGNDPAETVEVKLRYQACNCGSYPYWRYLIWVSAGSIGSNRAIRVEVYYETPNAPTSGSGLTLSRVNVDGWIDNPFGGINKVAILFSRSALGSDLECTASVNGQHVAQIDMRYPWADLDYSDVLIGTHNGFRGRVQNLQGVQLIQGSSRLTYFTEQDLEEFVRHHDSQYGDYLWGLFQPPDKNVENVNFTETVEFHNLVFTAPNGTRYRLSIENDGSLTTTEL